MAVEATALFISGGGELRDSFLPSTEALESDLVPTWLVTTQAQADSEVDTLSGDSDLWVMARVYELAYRAIVSHQSIEPTAEGSGTASVQRNKEGKEYFKQRLVFWQGVRQSFLTLPEDGLNLPEVEPVTARAAGIVIGSRGSGSMTDALGEW